MKGKLWVTFIPSSQPAEDGAAPKGVSILARDFQVVTLYKADGSFAGVRRIGSGTPIEVEGMQISIDAAVGSTGLEVKADPGVPYVYAGFGGMLIQSLRSACALCDVAVVAVHRCVPLYAYALHNCITPDSQASPLCPCREPSPGEQLCKVVSAQGIEQSALQNLRPWSVLYILKMTLCRYDDHDAGQLSVTFASVGTGEGWHAACWWQIQQGHSWLRQ